MFYKTFIVSGVLMLSLFSYAQYHGWSVWSINETKPLPGSSRSGHHK